MHSEADALGRRNILLTAANNPIASLSASTGNHIHAQISEARAFTRLRLGWAQVEQVNFSELSAQSCRSKRPSMRLRSVTEPAIRRSRSIFRGLMSAERIFLPVAALAKQERPYHRYRPAELAETPRGIMAPAIRPGYASRCLAALFTEEPAVRDTISSWVAANQAPSLDGSPSMRKCSFASAAC